MVKFQKTIVIDCPLGEVFEFFQNPSNYLLWLSGIERLETSNDYKVGSLLKVKMLKSDTITSGEVLANNDRDYIKFRSTAGPIKFTTIYKFRALGHDKTEVQLDYSIDARGIWAAEPMLEESAKERYATDFEKLKDILENRH